MVSFEDAELQGIVLSELARQMASPVARYVLRDRAWEREDLESEMWVAAYEAYVRFAPAQVLGREAVGDEYYRMFRRYVRRAMSWRMMDLARGVRLSLRLYGDEYVEEVEDGDLSVSV